MIKLTRTRHKDAIPSGLCGKSRERKNLDVLKLKRQLGDIPSSEFNSSLWKPAKTQLQKESHNKCAYCEADTRVVAHGDVEHFRPKNVYWWLVYCYDNYLYACQICNQTFKSNLFPISGKKIAQPAKITSATSDDKLQELAPILTPDPLEAGEPFDRFKAAVEDEEPDLIDPYMFDPEEILIWVANETLKEVRAVVAPRTPKHAAKQEAIDNVFGLNREELKSVRYQDYKAAMMIGKALPVLIDTQGEDSELVKDMKQQLNDMMADDHRFAGMIRYFVRKVWKIHNLDA